jgi:hypothetical protein
MSTTFTPAQPPARSSIAGVALHTSGRLLGKACRLSIDLYRGLAANNGTAPAQREESLSAPKQPAPPVRKPRKTFSMAEMEQVPTVLRYSEMSASEWYEQHVLNAVNADE